MTPSATVSKDIWVASGSGVTKEGGLAREKLRKGDVVAFNDNVHFPALLWNNAHTNKLVFVPTGPDYASSA